MVNHHISKLIANKCLSAACLGEAGACWTEQQTEAVAQVLDREIFDILGKEFAFANALALECEKTELEYSSGRAQGIRDLIGNIASRLHGENRANICEPTWILDATNPLCPEEIVDEIINIWNKYTLRDGEYLPWNLEENDFYGPKNIYPALYKYLNEANIKNCLLIWGW
jgi:hypothetical protein